MRRSELRASSDSRPAAAQGSKWLRSRSSTSQPVASTNPTDPRWSIAAGWRSVPVRRSRVAGRIAGEQRTVPRGSAGNSTPDFSERLAQRQRRWHGIGPAAALSGAALGPVARLRLGSSLAAASFPSLPCHRRERCEFAARTGRLRTPIRSPRPSSPRSQHYPPSSHSATSPRRKSLGPEL